MALPAPVKTYHTTTYPAINPTLPTLSQKGQNVFITGASQGIGREMALSFAKANVTNLAILGRKKNLLDEVKETINKTNSDVSVYVYTADLTDGPAVERVFSEFTSAIGGPIHTLVANAGYTPGFSSALDASEDHLIKTINDNLGGIRNTYRAFVPHIGKENLPGLSYKARFIHTSTGAAHTNMPFNSSYSIAKVATAKYMEFVSMEQPEVQVIGFHPGLIKTQMADDVDEEAVGLKFDDISLPADWAVWAASKNSSFLGSGRLVWAHWDVDELKETFVKYDNGEVSDGTAFGPFTLSKNFTLGLIGWP